MGDETRTPLLATRIIRIPPTAALAARDPTARRGAAAVVDEARRPMDAGDQRAAAAVVAAPDGTHIALPAIVGGHVTTRV